MTQLSAQWPVNDLDVEALMSEGVACILAEESFEALVEALFDFFIAAADQVDNHDPKFVRALAYTAGRALWNATPLPSNSWRPRLIPEPGRNDRCPCGSGAKFKQCCGVLPMFVPFETELVWLAVIEAANAEQMRDLLQARRMPVEAATMAAHMLLNDNRPDEVVPLLEPFLAPPLQRIDERSANAVSPLADAYLALGRETEVAGWLEALTQSGPRPLKAAAAQRLARLQGDRGEHASAWQSFALAQRLDPESLPLLLLEVVLLVCEQRLDEARERATHWLAQLEDDESVPEMVIDFMRTATRDPQGAASGDSIPDLGVDVERVRAIATRMAAQPIRGDYQLANAPVIEPEPGGLDLGDSAASDGASPADAGALRVLHAPALADIEAQWHARYRAPKPVATQLTAYPEVDPWVSADEWLGFLEQHPRAADSLDILDDLSTALQSELAEDEDTDTVLEPLLTRAWQIIDRATQAEPDAQLTWENVENRCGLRLAVRYALWLGDTDAARTDEVIDRVLRWNPNDNHGLRAVSMNRLLQRQDWRGALALAGRYPGDLDVNIAFGRCLALFARGDQGEALGALRDALRVNPHVTEALIRANLPAPHIGEQGVTPGSRDEAYFYRLEARDLWIDTDGAIEWLQRNGTLRRGRGR